MEGDLDPYQFLENGKTGKRDNRIHPLLNHRFRRGLLRQKQLKRLFEDSPGLYEITQLKRQPKDFSVSEIKREIHRREQISK